MSYSKRILFGDDPADDGVRQRLSETVSRRLEPFKFTIPTRRRNRLGAGPHWDRFWPWNLTAAAKELSIETVQINSKMCVRTQAECDAIRARAEVLHQASIKEYLDPNSLYGRLRAGKR